jgi:hypothetical protein
MVVRQILWYIDPLLSGYYVKSKCVPIVRQQTHNNATVGPQQWNLGVFIWPMQECYKQGTKSVES